MDHIPRAHITRARLPTCLTLGGLVSSTLVSLLLIPPLSARWLRI
ncbi:MAG: hypothetical protein ACLP2F_00635 [Steroidobacteraceae bacterium]